MEEQSNERISTLDILYFQEEREYWKRRLFLEEALPISAEAFQLYAFCVDMFSDYPVQDESPTKFALLQLIVGSQMQLGPTISNLLRGHAADGLSQIRKAIEFALFAFNLFEYPDSPQKWIDAGRDQTAWKEYRDAFNIMDMLDLNTYRAATSNEKPLLELLIQRYEQCCVPVHATHLSITANMKLTDTEDGKGIDFGHLDSLPEIEVLRLYLWIIDTHLMISKLYMYLLERLLPNFEYAYGSGLMERAEAAVHECCKKWESQLRPAGMVLPDNKFWDIPKKPRSRRKPKS